MASAGFLRCDITIFPFAISSNTWRRHLETVLFVLKRLPINFNIYQWILPVAIISPSLIPSPFLNLNSSARKSIVFLYQYEFLDIYSVLWIISQDSPCCPNCYSFGHWEPSWVGACALSTCPHPFLSTALLSGIIRYSGLSPAFPALALDSC